MRKTKGRNKEEPQTEYAKNQRFIKRTQRIGAAVLVLPAVAGAILSWQGLFEGSSTAFPVAMAAIFSLLVDALAVGASARWVATVRQGTPNQGWRLLAHGAIAATVAMNGYAAYPQWELVPWHVVPALVWSAITELVAKDFAQQHRDETKPAGDGIRLALWIASPVESLRTKLRQARAGEPSAIQARADVTHIAAAKVAVRRTAKGLQFVRDRRIIARQLRRGALAPAKVPELVQQHSDDPSGLLPAVQAAVLEHAARNPIGARSNGADVDWSQVTVDGQPVTLTTPPGQSSGSVSSVSSVSSDGDRELVSDQTAGQVAGQSADHIDRSGPPVSDREAGQGDRSVDHGHSDRSVTGQSTAGQSNGQNVVTHPAVDRVDRSASEVTTDHGQSDRSLTSTTPGQSDQAVTAPVTDRPVTKVDQAVQVIKDRYRSGRITYSYIREVGGVAQGTAKKVLVKLLQDPSIADRVPSDQFWPPELVSVDQEVTDQSELTGQ